MSAPPLVLLVRNDRVTPPKIGAWNTIAILGAPDHGEGRVAGPATGLRRRGIFRGEDEPAEGSPLGRARLPLSCKSFFTNRLAKPAKNVPFWDT